MDKIAAGSVRVRFAPSPTGPFHFGNARTALFNWLFARRMNGKFILRIEDTDAERSEKRHEEGILDGLSWLGIDWDEGPNRGGEYGPYYQSERRDIYERYLAKLLEEGKAYYCYCTQEELDAQRESMLSQGLPPRYNSHCRNNAKPTGRKPQVIRFKTPEVRVTFKDIIRGQVSFDAALLGDMAIAKSVREPLYNCAVVIDDYEMRISHVIRGEDHLPNTPKQILLAHAFGFQESTYAHLPLILGPDRRKLSKRYLEASLIEYCSRGYLPEAVVNFLALLGWHPKDDREILTKKELVEEFDLRRAQKAGAVFQAEKLEWMNSQHLRQLDDATLAARLLEFLTSTQPASLFGEFKLDTSDGRALLAKIVRVERERMKTFADFIELAGFFFVQPEYEPELLLWQSDPPSKAQKALVAVRDALAKLTQEEYAREKLHDAVSAILTEQGTGSVLWPLRVALSGRRASPDPFDILTVLKPEESMQRISRAIDKLSLIT